MTERKIEMRRHGPPRNSVSAVSSITSTLPWAGATMTLASEGTFGFGSRKNQRQKRENNSQSPNKKPAMPFRKAPTSIDAMPMTTTPSSATSVQKINFSAAWVALPLCFMPAILIGGGGEGKEDICQEGARPSRSLQSASYLFSVVGTSRCDVRAACSGATPSIASVAPIFVPPATTRAGTAQRAIPTIALNTYDAENCGRDDRAPHFYPRELGRTRLHSATSR